MTLAQENKIRTALTMAHYDFEKGLNARAFFKTNSHTIGKDLVQDTFIKTWSYLLKGGKIDIMKAFLYHVLNNLIVDQYRKHKTTSLDVLLEKGFDPGASEQPEHLFNMLDGKAALPLISLLPETYQKVIRMKYIQDLSLEEISIITKQSKSTIAVQIHRGVEKLKLIYKK